MSAAVLRYGRLDSLSAPKQIQQNCQQYAQNDHRRDGNEGTAALRLDADIARISPGSLPNQLSNPGA